ncbi:MAG: hypothetical protein Fues2KO_04170 [Fuerstiella sp.]
MQHLLTSHPDVTIFGQEPPCFTWGDVLLSGVRGVEFAEESNQTLAYDVPHYTAPPEQRDVAEKLFFAFRWYLTGGRNVNRWGVKSLTQCRIAADVLYEFWPETKWIVAIRDPFKNLVSLRNTFDPELRVSAETLATWWVDAVSFAYTHPAALPVHVDRLSTQSQRHCFAEELLRFIDVESCPDVLGFVDEWPVIHKVISDDKRRYILDPDDREQMLSNPEFGAWLERLGYEN